jgi:PAS domain S-box-containing protein
MIERDNLLTQTNGFFGTWLLCGLLALAILLIDTAIPLGVAGGVPYVAVILLALRLPGRRYLIGFATLCTVLTVLGFFLSPPGGEFWQVVTNRLLAIAAIWVTAVLLLQRRQAELALQQAHNTLESRVRERTAELTTVNHRLQREIAERRQAVQALRASEQRFRLAVDNMPDLLIIYDNKRRFQFVNARGLALSGRRADEVIGRTDEEVFSPQQTACYLPALTRAMATRLSQTTECRLTLAEGTRTLVVTYVPLLDDQENLQEILGITHDITDRKRREEQMQQQQAELAHLSRLNIAGEMAAGLSHELNQPLSAITTYTGTCLQLLRSGTFDPDKLIDWLDKVANQGVRAGEIIRHLRTFLGKRSFQKTPLELNSLIREVAHLANFEARRQGISLQLELADSLPRVAGDNIQLQQVILNLVRNAIEAMHAMPAEERELTLHAAPAGHDEVEIRVADTGPGLTPEAMDKLFQPFFTTKPTGMGLGLSLSKSIIEAHGGKLWVTPNPRRGVTFHITMPVLSSTNSNNDGLAVSSGPSGA